MSSPEPADLQKLVPGLTVFHRFEDRAYDEGHQGIQLRRFVLDRVSGSGQTAWVRRPWGQGPKRFSLASEHPWASTSIEEAWRGFLRRKRWQASFLRQQLAGAEASVLAGHRLSFSDFTPDGAALLVPRVTPFPD